MTLLELYALARSRHGWALKRFHPSTMKCWLDSLVDEGLLSLVRDRYYLTDSGFEIASQLDNGLSRRHDLEVSA
jgi:hypothetical protein